MKYPLIFFFIFFFQINFIYAEQTPECPYTIYWYKTPKYIDNFGPTNSFSDYALHIKKYCSETKSNNLRLD